MNKTTLNAPKKKNQLLHKLKNFLYCLLGLGGVLLFIGGIMMWASWYEDEEIKEIRKGNTSAIGTIVRVGTSATAEYFVDGKRYERRQGRPANIYVGEHYVVIYKATAPHISRIDYEIPIFLKGEETDTTVGTIISDNGVTVGFTYRLYGQDIERFQHYPKDIELHKGQTFPVVYLIKNPNVGVLKMK